MNVGIVVVIIIEIFGTLLLSKLLRSDTMFQKTTWLNTQEMNY